MTLLSKIYSVTKYLRPQKRTMHEIQINEALRNTWCSKSGKSVIFIEGLLETPVSIIEKSRIAKAIEEEHGGVSYAILKGFHPSSNRTSFLFEAMGVSRFINWWTICLRPQIILKALSRTLNVYRTNLTGVDLISMRHGGILIGDLIYDSIIRHNPGTYTIDKIRGLNSFRIILRAFTTFFANEVMIERYKPTHLVTSHMVYAEFGLLARQSSRAGCEVHLKDMSVYYKYKDYSTIHQHYLSVNQADFELALANQEVLDQSIVYFERRLAGSVNELDVKNAFQGKKKYTKDELFRKCTGFEHNGKLNVVVFAHAFSDAPHVGMGMIFKDYYEWLRTTLFQLSKTDKYNVFVKEHPGSYLYGEIGAVKRLIEGMGSNLIFLLPSDLNTVSIREFSDVVITAQGTAGLEFTALGKPVLTAGETYYSKNGISNCATSKASYIEHLCDLERLSCPSEEEKKRALLHLYLTFSRLNRSEVLPTTEILPGDDYIDLYDKCLQEFLENLERNIPIKDDFYRSITKAA